MIELKNISKQFGKLQVLDTFSVHCRAGQCIVLVGPNGSGKTTLIKCILGMVMPASGEILFQEKTINRDWKYRKHIGYMPQIGRYPDNMTIFQVLDMMKDLRKSEGAFFDEELIQLFGIEKIGHKRMNTLSGGTRQKVSACLAFLFDARVLILDEPTAGLDPVSSEILKEKIRKEKEKGKLILITSHVLSEMDDLVTEVILMQEGKLIFHRSMESLRTATGEEKLARAIAKILSTQDSV